MLLSDLWMFIVPFALAAGLPGPAQGALIAQTLAKGGRSTIPFVAGMVAGNLVWLTMAVFGLTALAVHYEWLFWALKWLGVAYLLFIAWKLWTANAPEQSAEDPDGQGLLSGALVTLGNPKAVIFFGAVLPHAFDMSSLTTGQITLILILGLLIDLTTQSLYLLLASRARRLVTSARTMRIINRASAGVIGTSATLIAVRT
jgi:threonine/homoserine/homoserine lactone efflux protein